MGTIHKITLPKWGLSMASARVNGWLKEIGTVINTGEELVEVETEKIAGAVATSGGGVLRQQLAQVGDVVPVGGLLAVVAAADVPEKEIDAVVAEFRANFAVQSAAEAEAGPQPEKVAGLSRTLRDLRGGGGAGGGCLVPAGGGGR